MTLTSFLPLTHWLRAPQARETTAPDRKTARAPVFIHDAITPWQDATMLLKLLQAEDAKPRRSPD